MNAHHVQVIVEVRLACTEVPAKQRGVCGEDGAAVDVARAQVQQADPGQPLVEVGDDQRLAGAVLDELQQIRRARCRQNYVLITSMWNILMFAFSLFTDVI